MLPVHKILWRLSYLNRNVMYAASLARVVFRLGDDLDLDLIAGT